MIERATRLLTRPGDRCRLLVLPLFLLILGSFVHVHAQETESTLVYKFSVQGVGDRAEAKLVQKALLEREPVASCDYIPECACFTLVSTIVLDRAALNAWLLAIGKEVTGVVEVSNGQLLPPPEPADR